MDISNDVVIAWIHRSFSPRTIEASEQITDTLTSPYTFNYLCGAGAVSGYSNINMSLTYNIGTIECSSRNVNTSIKASQSAYRILAVGF